MLKKVMMQIIGPFLTSMKQRRVYTNPNIKIGKSAFISVDTVIKCNTSGSVEIGEHVCINELCSISTWDNTIKIGEGVLIGPSTVINTMNHQFNQTDVPIWKQRLNEKPIIIEEDVWIGAHCTILGGVKIGKHSVIGAHSLVTKDIPPYSVAYGVPCKVKRTRDR